jgi:predicted alpha/beta-hydrolase family hydrolase
VREVTIQTPGGVVSASVHGEGAVAVVLGHGAGGTRRQPLLGRVAEGLASSGRLSLLYNFPYSEARRRAPDKPALLEAATRAVGEFARDALGARRVVHGGKSMGGRIASQAAADGMPADGLVFLGYPLHPPGRPDTLRDRHLPNVACPMLFLQGTRDGFARWDLVEGACARLAGKATLHRLEGADHSFGVLRRSGRTSADVERELIDATIGWLGRLGL